MIFMRNQHPISTFYYSWHTIHTVLIIQTPSKITKYSKLKDAHEHSVS